MANVQYHSETCIVKQEGSGKEVEAVVHNFTEHQNLCVILNKSVKLVMKWNSRCYEGRMAGMDFISDGPRISNVKTSR